MNKIEELKDKYFPVLDKGFCAVVDHMGDDHAIARAARCSYGEGTKKVSDDRGLIRTLVRDSHTSPIEMCEIVLHVGMPIFVARQWVRHRTASLNEYSGRYSIMPMQFYEPEYTRHQTQSKTNKQGSSTDLLGEHQYAGIVEGRREVREQMKNQYHDCLEVDLSRELSRIDLPLSTYTYWYWKIDLKNLLHFLKLRLDPHAQWEIQQYARVIAGMVKEWVPYTWEAFNDYQLNGVKFSKQEQTVLCNILKQPELCIENNSKYIIGMCQSMSMTDREIQGFITKFDFMRSGRRLYNDIELDPNTAKSPEFYSQQIEKAAHA